VQPLPFRHLISSAAGRCHATAPVRRRSGAGRSDLPAASSYRLRWVPTSPRICRGKKLNDTSASAQIKPLCEPLDDRCARCRELRKQRSPVQSEAWQPIWPCAETRLPRILRRSEWAAPATRRRAGTGRQSEPSFPISSRCPTIPRFREASVLMSGARVKGVVGCVLEVCAESGKSGVFNLVSSTWKVVYAPASQFSSSP
jgi:hypothetical protein